MQDFRRLRVWNAARAFRRRVYAVSARFPPEERYGLTAQVRDAARSIHNNLAEGCGRSTDADFARFVHNSMGSTFECLDHLVTAADEGYLSREDFGSLSRDIETVRGMLIALLTRLREE